MFNKVKYSNKGIFSLFFNHSEQMLPREILWLNHAVNNKQLLLETVLYKRLLRLKVRMNCYADYQPIKSSFNKKNLEISRFEARDQ